MGKQDVNAYANNEPVVFNREFQVYEEAMPTGTIHYKKNKKIASFDNLEPRLAVAYPVNHNLSFKASYNRMSQYIHLISNTASASPLDIWAPSDQSLRQSLICFYCRLAFVRCVVLGKPFYELRPNLTTDAFGCQHSCPVAHFGDRSQRNPQ